MDYYANDSLGAWTVNNEAHRPVRTKPKRIVKSKTGVPSSVPKPGCASDAPCVGCTPSSGNQKIIKDNVT